MKEQIVLEYDKEGNIKVPADFFKGVKWRKDVHVFVREMDALLPVKIIQNAYDGNKLSRCRLISNELALFRWHKKLERFEWYEILTPDEIKQLKLISKPKFKIGDKVKLVEILRKEEVDTEIFKKMELFIQSGAIGKVIHVEDDDPFGGLQVHTYTTVLFDEEDEPIDCFKDEIEKVQPKKKTAQKSAPSKSKNKFKIGNTIRLTKNIKIAGRIYLAGIHGTVHDINKNSYTIKIKMPTGVGGVPHSRLIVFFPNEIEKVEVVNYNASALRLRDDFQVGDRVYLWKNKPGTIVSINNPTPPFPIRVKLDDEINGGHTYNCDASELSFISSDDIEDDIKVGDKVRLIKISSETEAAVRKKWENVYNNIIKSGEIGVVVIAGDIDENNNKKLYFIEFDEIEGDFYREEIEKVESEEDNNSKPTHPEIIETTTSTLEEGEHLDKFKEHLGKQKKDKRTKIDEIKIGDRRKIIHRADGKIICRTCHQLMR